MSVIARYLHANGYSAKEIEKKLETYILTIDRNASIAKWQSTIDKYVAAANKYGLIEIESVPITVAEINTINLIQSKPLQRLAFTLLCVAKFYNITNPNNNNWVNKSDKEIFGMANIQTSTARQSLLINDLHTMGLIGYSRLVDNINLNVKFIDNDSDIALHITDFRNLGYQYLQHIGEASFVECEVCGLLMKRTSNRLKYCPECAIEINRAKSAERWKRASGL